MAASVLDMPDTDDEVIAIGGGGGSFPLDFYEDTYTVTLRRNLAYGPNKFKPDEDQYTLEFSIDDLVDPSTGQLYVDENGNPATVRGYYTPKIYAFSESKEPKLYQLLKALNGGVPVEGPRDANGEVPRTLRRSVVTDLITDFIGRSCLMDLEPKSEGGWPRITSGVPPKAIRPKRQRVSAVVVDEADDIVDENF
jgi:hypothetical protein